MREHSRHALCKPHRWHLQQAGTGPTTLLINGAGGATQSFRHLFPILARTNTDMIVGHPAGVPIALRLTELRLRPGLGIVGINAALGNLKGIAGWLFTAMAKVLAATPFSAEMFCATTTPSSVQKLIAGTGSRLDAEGQALYLRRARDTGHVGATLSMMAQWSLDDLLGRLPRIMTPITLIVGDQDKAVPPQTSHDAARILPNATVVTLPNLGHLAHEEDASAIANIIQKQTGRQGFP